MSGLALLQTVKVAILDFVEFFVGAVLDHTTLVQHDDAVALHDCGHAVRNHHASAALHRPVQRLLDYFLGLFVQSAGCLVENHDFRRLN